MCLLSANCFFHCKCKTHTHSLYSLKPSAQILFPCSRDLTPCTRGIFPGVLRFGGSRGCGFEPQVAFCRTAFQPIAQKQICRHCTRNKHSVSLSAFPNILVSIHKIRVMPASNLWSRYWWDLQADRTVAVVLHSAARKGQVSPAAVLPGVTRFGTSVAHPGSTGKPRSQTKQFKPPNWAKPTRH